MTRANPRRKRERGSIDALPSGALRVRVYAGMDPLSGQRNYLTEIVPAGPSASTEAEKARTKLLSQVDEQRNPKTKATVNQLLDRYLELLDIEENTRTGYEGYVKNHIRPVLGELQVAKVTGETLDAFYGKLRKCRVHCGGRSKRMEHRTERKHECDDRCGPHQCKPLATATIRQIHYILSGAFKRAVRWRWVALSPIAEAEVPPPPAPNPHPPTPEQAAAIILKAFTDPGWGMLVWLAMVTGARRGELCALRWDLLNLDTGLLSIKTSVAQRHSRTWEKDTKTHQQRRIALDADTVQLLRAYRQRCEAAAALLGLSVAADGRLFSLDPDHGTWMKPDSVSQRYTRMCAQLGWDMNLHELRHYSATELISAGVDVRTVAGWLGHGGGGTTTLKVYAAWKSEADQRAAGTLSARMPPAPLARDADGAVAFVAASEPAEPTSPYRRIAADLRSAISWGALKPGDQVPTLDELAVRYGASVGTVHRAVGVLKDEGLVLVATGKRTIVVQRGAGDS